jgi:hypothetical protein
MIKRLHKKVISGLLSAALAVSVGAAAMPGLAAAAEQGDAYTYDFTTGGSQYVREMIRQKLGDDYVTLYNSLVDELAAKTVSGDDFGNTVDITFYRGDGILPDDADNTKIMSLVKMISNDEPQFYWIGRYGMSWNSWMYTVKIYPSETYKSASARADTNNALISELGYYHELLASKKGTFFKIAALNDTLADRTKYDDKRVNNDKYDSIGCLRDHLCVCDGYAKAFELIANSEGLGDTVRLYTDSHAWNAINFNDRWYYLDVTFDDPILGNVNTPNSQFWRNYFLKSVAGFTSQDSTHDDPDLLYSEFERPEISANSYIYSETIGFDAPSGLEKGDCTYVINNEYISSRISRTATLNDWNMDFTEFADGRSDGTYQMTFSSPNAVSRDVEIRVKYGAPTEQLDIKLKAQGDINGDGKINATDLLMIKAMLKGVSELDEYSQKCADITGDGDVKSADLLRIKAHIKGVTPIW